MYLIMRGTTTPGADKFVEGPTRQRTLAPKGGNPRSPRFLEPHPMHEWLWLHRVDDCDWRVDPPRCNAKGTFMES